MDVPGDFPFFFEDIFDVLNNFQNLTPAERLKQWADNDIENAYDFSFQSLEFETENINPNTDLPHLVLTQAQNNLVKDVYRLYHHWKKILYSTKKGGVMLFDMKKSYYPFLH
jgi:hypothetical protein